MAGIPGYRDTPIQPWDDTASVSWDEAEQFIRLFHRENRDVGPVERRLARVRAEIEDTGTYAHTRRELTFGAQAAWRNASRCVGRLYWRSLVVRDRRGSGTAEQIFDDLVDHLRLAGGGPASELHAEDATRRAGRIRPVISIFAPARPGRPYPRVWNEQLIRYAGYRLPDGRVVGDPRYVDFTETVTRLGWQGKRGEFDVLPLAIEAPGDGVRLFELPEDTVLEVSLRHPEQRWFAELGLRWHAVPVISNMRLTIGGVHYPLAPFNGWYLGTEIGARNLADPDRYDLLPAIAARLGLDTTSEATLWRDRALVELNRAVLWSFQAAGVRISDHHTEARRFLAHVERERRAGRRTPADWSWIVPPMSGAATPVFHRYYHEADQRPNFYLDAVAAELARYGRIAAPAVADPRVVPKPRQSVGGCPLASAPEPARLEPRRPAEPRRSVPAAPEPRVPEPRQPLGREVLSSLR
ncbi:nitric oxide synthase oxygenase [Rugosimonospora acidiphila]|uniref:Nitric oxide synthase oxygenase n=1 Tax=Rugosimonospora acidiphila TaxID=556531 RepID=A0ABP9RNZ6_9ACTN